VNPRFMGTLLGELLPFLQSFRPKAESDDHPVDIFFLVLLLCRIIYNILYPGSTPVLLMRIKALVCYQGAVRSNINGSENGCSFMVAFSTASFPPFAAKIDHRSEGQLLPVRSKR